MHLAGALVGMERRYAIAALTALRVIEDAARAPGSSGDPVSFGFHPNRNAASIEGGAPVLNNEDEAAFAQKYRLPGATGMTVWTAKCSVESST